ncbi:hypothetical protein THARTR1_10322 [Trichoderma harzianum]|uniref:Uncharacterized protein n=1 Tax=Trichoderma harzianum TaxID=5544 RepID=A0A2K0TST5_TRIHA|nr:hypothetical protein THARTR1_10322 [Trichoderma harzianum]
MENLGYNDVDKSQLWNHDPNELFNLFCWLIQALPKSITLVFLIDEAYIYERDEYAEGLFVFDELLRLAADPTFTTMKLLFTSTRRTGYLRPKFQPEDLIINVEGIPQQTGMPSEGRMLRRMQRGLDEDDSI